MVSRLPFWFEDLHRLTHNFEIPLLIFSGVVVLFGWWIFWKGQKKDAARILEEASCAHNGCTKTQDSHKRTASIVLKIASILFALNLGVYVVFHEKKDGFLNYISYEDVATHDDNYGVTHHH